jgi:putative aldouronate transport system permease protein
MGPFQSHKISDKIFDLINWFMLIFLTIIFLYPMWHVIMASFSDPYQLISHTGLIFLPLGFSLKGYNTVLNNFNILIGYSNTAFYVCIGTALNMIMTVLAAYVLSRRNLMIKKGLTLMIVFTMYLSAGMIPDFLLVKYLGLYNSRLAIILPNAITTWNLIVMRTSFNQIPRSLEESAMIDGAGDFSVLFKIILPVSKAALAVMILFYAVGHWNSWFSAVIYLRDRSKFPLQLFLREILAANASMGSGDAVSAVDAQFLMEELIKYCSVVVSTVPILFIYPLVQKYFIAGVMLGSLKE